MRKYIIALLLLNLLLTGCAKKEEANIKVFEETIHTTESETQSTKNKKLTIVDVESLAVKRGELKIEDFAPYMDLSSLHETGSLRKILEFEYNGKEMCLKVSASDKNLIVAPYNGQLDSAVIFDKEFLEIDSMEEEYAYQGDCADIRSGNLEHILNGTVVIEDYLSVKLPEGILESDFKFWLGSYGGVAFLEENEKIENITLKNAGIYAEEHHIGGIEIWGSGEIRQNTEIIETMDSLMIDDVTLWRGILQTESGNTWYVAYTEKEESSISYCLYLNKERFLMKEFLEISETIQLMENAIY